ncbi:MAG: DUF4860 domain-containing protein [Coriobacteriales bacterium]|jgi:hypothetical protein|nr:DUF4860 domain-containing protein [Coriobacteriales bacterium]
MSQLKQHNADLAIVLLLFFVYAGCALMLCVLGANSYGHTAAVLEESYNQRSGVLYIAQKFHQNDIGGGVRLDSYQGSDALVLIEQETGKAYETWIFVLDGYLCEELIAPDSTLVADQAQRIMPLQELRLTRTGDALIAVSLSIDAQTVNTIHLALRSSGGGFTTEDRPPAAAPSSDDARASGPTIMTPAPDGEGGS